MNELDGIEVIVIGPGTPAQAAACRIRNRVELPIYADPTGFTQSSLGFERFVLKAAQQSGVAIVDGDRVVRYYHKRTVPEAALDTDEIVAAARAVRDGA